MEWIIIGVVALVVVLFFLIMKAKNTLVIRKNKVKNSWANVDVQLQRRCDLIPNLVEVVQSFATHELQIIEIEETSKNVSVSVTEDATDENTEE